VWIVTRPISSRDRLVLSQPLSGLAAYAKAYLSVGNQ
jgi:hypothetical protein